MITATILLVDDEPSLLKVMGTYLTRLGCTVRSFSSTDVAWREVSAHAGTFDVAVIDLSLPGMSSHELARRLIAANPRIRVILSSGYTGDVTDLEQEAPGRVTFLQKPFAPEKLARQVRHMSAGLAGSE